MSWADDIRCLYCDGRLPLYRKITNGQFCSSAHRKAYWQEQERLAVERLHQTHDSLIAHKPRVPVEAILGPEPDVPQPERPVWMVASNTGEVPLAGLIHDSAVIRPRWLVDRIALSDFEPILVELAPRSVFGGFLARERVVIAAAVVRVPMFAARSLAGVAATRLGAAAFNIIPLRDLPAALAPLAWIKEDTGESIEGPAPLHHLLVLLPSISPISPAGAAVKMRESVALEPAMRAQLPRSVRRVEAALSEIGLRPAGLHRLSVNGVPIAAVLSAGTLAALDVRADAPRFTPHTPPLRPRLRLAAGRRYAVAFSSPASRRDVATSALEISAPGISLPERTVNVMRAVPAAAPQPVQPRDVEPAPAGLLRLEFSAVAAESNAVRPILALPQPPRPEPMRPVCRLEPRRDLMAGTDSPLSPVDPQRANVWALATDFWNRAPRDLKILAFALPLLLGLALHPPLPKVRVSTSSSVLGRDVQNAVNTHWASFKQSVFDRAAIALDEDFRSGLDDWMSRGDATADWSFDATGFVRPGPLALYRPSLALTDYQLQFLGIIDKKALSWVVRASDFNNYYVVKLVVLKPGPLPEIGVTRYAVVDGRADSRADVVARIDVRADTLYRVRVDVSGEDFSLFVQDQLVDHWSEPRLSHGGVGFFSARGEQSRVRWVQVTHQYDMLGRLCAYLAPYNIPPANGSLEQ